MLVVVIATLVALAACGMLIGLNERDARRPGRFARGLFFSTFAVVQIGSAAVLATGGLRFALWYAGATAAVLAAWAGYRAVLARGPR